MTRQQILKNLASQFPHLPQLDLQIIAQTIAPLTLTELKALHYSVSDNTILKTATERIIQQWEEEKQLSHLEAQHQIWDEYYHCCGGW